MNEEAPIVAQLATLLGIVSQLYTTRMNTLLRQYGFTLSQFALLNHLARNPKNEHSISELTDAMEINQPGVTKLVKKLSEEGFVAVASDREDSRKKLVSITPVGREKILAVSLELAPDVTNWFAAWDTEDLSGFTQHLAKLAEWLDTNRITT